MSIIDKASPVMVTGATGYIAGWVVKTLLENGFKVHAAIRDVKNIEKREHLDTIANESSGEIKYFESDLLDSGSYREAMIGCQLVMHIASPFLLDSKDAQKELINPALEGTKNVLKTVNETESVRRVVLTSSVAAIYGDAIEGKNITGGLFDETMWNTTSSSTNNEYSYSKTVAEREAWRMCGEQKRWELVAINPSFVVGPALNIRAEFESKKFMLQMGNGDLKSGAPNIKLGMVDVRDVGLAHFNAGLYSHASGRYILSSESLDFLKISEYLREKFGNNYPFPKRNAPKFMIWLMAPFLGINRSFVSRNIGYEVFFNNSRSKKDLSIDYTPIKRSVVEFFQQFIDEKLV
ncbi:MAG: NAD-dependent epimerase/dehydratase family protein [Candidatus Neomarinimicrobiota bacterium]